MNIFYKRPLALILCITVGGFAFLGYSSIPTKITVASITFVIFLFSFLKLDYKQKAMVRISSFSLLLATLFSLIYFDLWFKAYERYDERVTVTATVAESEPISTYSNKVTFKCDNINETFLSGYKFIAYLSRDESHNLLQGSVVKFTAEINDFANEEARNTSFAHGINGIFENVKDIEVIKTKAFYLPSILSRMRENISRYITILSDSDSGSLLSALLVGERDKLSPDVRLNFKRIGITHVLALSGMHLAILYLGLDKLLLLLRVKKKTRVAVNSTFILLYMILTGLPVSVCRAGLMLLLSSALFLISKTKDSLTSLSVAVFLICFFEPYSIYDIALWLSALATFGLILLAEYYSSVDKAQSVSGKVLKFITFGILSSLFAISATLLITLLTFGGISALGIFATLIFSILIEAIMYLGCITLVIGWLLPTGKLLSPLCNFTTELAEKFAKPDLVYVRNDFTLALILAILLTILLIVFAVMKIKHKRAYLSVFALVFVLCHVVPILHSAKISKAAAVTYYSSNKSDDFLVRSNGTVAYISSSQYSDSLAYDAIDFMNENFITSLDVFYVTHYSYNLEDELGVILSSIKTESVYIPKPQNAEESGILEKLYSFMQNYSSKIVLLDEYSYFDIGKYRVKHLYNVPYGEDTSMNAFSISNKTQTFCYLSSGLLKEKNSELFYKYIACSDQLILGSHGKKYKTKDYSLGFHHGLERLIINSGNLFLTQENMEKYAENGCEVISHPSKVELLK